MPHDTDVAVREHVEGARRLLFHLDSAGHPDAWEIVRGARLHLNRIEAELEQARPF